MEKNAIIMVFIFEIFLIFSHNFDNFIYGIVLKTQNNHLIPISKAFVEMNQNDIPKLEKIQRAVGKLNGTEIQTATGFLISPSLFMTNYHIINKLHSLQNASVYFNYQTDSNGVLQNVDKYTVDQDFLIGRDDNYEFDYSIIKLNDHPGNKWGYIPLNQNTTSIGENESAIIIQHPGGEPKQIVIANNNITKVRSDEIIEYTTDTKDGSSGSPVFDSHFNLIALHHGLTKNEDANEGTVIEKIKNDLKYRYFDNKPLLKELGID